MARPDSTAGMNFSVQARALLPVNVAVTGLGRSSKMNDKATTLYVLSVTQSGHTWYVARRYSEFRKLHDQLLVLLERKTCTSCSELATFHSHYEFPHRFRIRSGFSFSRKKIEESRIDALNEYVDFLVNTTQGLLCDDDDAYQFYGTHPCEAISIIRDFFMVPVDEGGNEYWSSSDDEPRNVKSRQNSRLARKKAELSTIRLRELDFVYRVKSVSSDRLDLMRQTSTESIDMCHESDRWNATSESLDEDTRIHHEQDFSVRRHSRHSIHVNDGLAEMRRREQSRH